jgi:AcrR family transcriptional regulator
VTVDAVTRAANVARATLYRYFPSGNDLLAAAFNTLIPPAPEPPTEGSLRDRLVAVLLAQAETVAAAPAVMTAMSWLALGRDLDELSAPRHLSIGESAIGTLRERIAQPSTRRRSTPYSTARRQPNWATLIGPARSLCWSARWCWVACPRCRTSTTASARTLPSTVSYTFSGRGSTRRSVREGKWSLGFRGRSDP